MPTAALLAACLALPGCQSPMDAGADSPARAAVLSAHRDFLSTLTDARVVELDRDSSEVEAGLTEEQLDELDTMSGMSAYEEASDRAGRDLMGEDETPTVALTLQRAIRLAIENNLDLQTARLTPRIGAQQFFEADAAFDATFFFDALYTDEEQPGPDTAAVIGLSGDVKSETLVLNTGIRQPLRQTNGLVTLETTLQRLDDDPSAAGVAPFYLADVLLQLNQPLLRNFGQDVATAQIQLTANARDAAVQDLRNSTINLVDAVVEAYWDVLLARQQLLIQTVLLERTIEDRDRIEDRLEFDASQVQFTEANCFVSLRRRDTIRAHRAWRTASDQLKRLLNASDLPLTGETLIIPADEPLDTPLSFSLLDSVTTALNERPDLQAALFDIDDALIRKRVADNGKLPVLDLLASVGLGGVGIEDAQDAYDDVYDGDFFDWGVGLNFEYPLGNRAAEAAFEQAVLENRQAVLAYRTLAQDAILEIKTALRELALQYELIGSTRDARRNSANNLRAIQAQEDAGTALTPEFLNLKLDAQQRLATAEFEEASALTAYMVAIAELYRAQGTLLEQMGIAFDDPIADEN
ncbi:MAG: TolC family protein [Planctomycetota bacterium]